MKGNIPGVLAAAIITAALAAQGATRASGEGQATTGMNDLAERYVKLVLALGQHDSDYVDAYYGPPEWKKEADGRKLPLDDLAARARALQEAVSATPAPATDLDRLRREYLERQLSALAAR